MEFVAGPGSVAQFGEQFLGGLDAAFGAGVAGAKDFVEIRGDTGANLSGEVAALRSDAGEHLE